jgi:CDP-4-dehydro-6-deoxyglucose reductase, E1
MSNIKFDLPSYIPATAKLVGDNEIALMKSAVDDAWLTTGRYNDLFEERLSKFIGIPHLCTTNSGSSANLLAISSLFSESLGSRRIKKGDEIITVAAGFPTTVNPIVQNGAIPVFVDIDLNTLNIRVDQIRSAISSKTKAIVLAHALGNPFDLLAVKKIAKEYNLWLVEDCCDALGSTVGKNHVGTIGDIATLSFYPAHHITMGEGGAVFTNSKELMGIVKRIRDWGRDCYCETGRDNTCGRRFGYQFGDLPFGYDHKYTYSEIGYNLKITDIQAACGVAQLDRLESFISARRYNFKMLLDGLIDCSDSISFATAIDDAKPSWFGFPIYIKDPNIRRLDLLEYLEQRNIGTRLLFSGNITKQPYFRSIEYKQPTELINTDAVMNNLFWIGVHPKLTKLEINYMIEKIRAFIGVDI